MPTLKVTLEITTEEKPEEYDSILDMLADLYHKDVAGKVEVLHVCPADVLSQERTALAADRDLYLDCLNNRPLRDRHTDDDIRDGLILFHQVYRTIRDQESGS